MSMMGFGAMEGREAEASVRMRMGRGSMGDGRQRMQTAVLLIVVDKLMAKAAPFADLGECPMDGDEL